MLRSEIQHKTGLTRKAMEYYEERGFIKPVRTENGYRDYSEEDLRILQRVSQLRKVGLTTSDIQEFLCSGTNVLSSALRKRQHRSEIENRRIGVLEMMVKGADEEVILRKLDALEKEETIYEKLERAFPGHFGQMIFISYQPFLQESLREGGSQAYDEYVKYLDALPPFELSDEERRCIEEISSAFDWDTLKSVDHEKRAAIEDPEKWFCEHEDAVKKYERFKNRKEYLESPMKKLGDRFRKYMEEHRYYEVAIPLIRRFSKSYDDYYMKLPAANDRYMKMRGASK